MDKEPQSGLFQFPTRIEFGENSHKNLVPHLLSCGLKRPFFVVDGALHDQPFVTRLVNDCTTQGLAVALFSEFSSNPLSTHVEEGSRLAGEHQANSIVGIGGGAALDMAKAISLLTSHGGNLFDYEDEKPGARPIDPDRLLPWFALGTTAGTGSEVGRSAVISDPLTQEKKIVFSPGLMAQCVFADPTLTYSLPAQATAATGMDAFTHCVESFLAKGFQPFCDGIALEGITYIVRSLPQAVRSATHRLARSEMLLASLMGGVAFQKGLGVTHSCAHALSAVSGMHHGLANGIMIDHALAYNKEACSAGFARLAATVGKKADPEEFFVFLRDLKHHVGIAPGLQGSPISGKHIPELAERAFKDSCHLNNPRPCDKAAFERIFHEAMAC